MHHVSQRRSNGPGRQPTDRRPITELYGASDLGYSAGYAEWRTRSIDEAGDQGFDSGGHDSDCGVCGIASAREICFSYGLIPQTETLTRAPTARLPLPVGEGSREAAGEGLSC